MTKPSRSFIIPVVIVALVTGCLYFFSVYTPRTNDNNTNEFSSPLSSHNMSSPLSSHNMSSQKAFPNRTMAIKPTNELRNSTFQPHTFIKSSQTNAPRKKGHLINASIQHEVFLNRTMAIKHTSHQGRSTSSANIKVSRENTYSTTASRENETFLNRTMATTPTNLLLNYLQSSFKNYSRDQEIFLNRNIAIKPTTQRRNGTAFLHTNPSRENVSNASRENAYLTNASRENEIFLNRNMAKTPTTQRRNGTALLHTNASRENAYLTNASRENEIFINRKMAPTTQRRNGTALLNTNASSENAYLTNASRETEIFLNRKMAKNPTIQRRNGTALSHSNPSSENDYSTNASRQNAVPKQRGVQVLMSSYMRSGSTFLGSIIGWREDSFYWFEPLWATHQNVYINSNGTHCHYCKQQCTVMAAFGRDLEESLGFIQDIYSCKFSQYYARVNHMLQHHADRNLVGPSWDVYRKCHYTNKRRCLQKLESVCLNKTHRVTKLLRMDLELSGRLLKTNPSLKIVHLFRDPRGQLNSHLHTGWYPVQGDNLYAVEKDMNVICDRMRRDLKAGRNLMHEFPGRVRIVQYEDFTNIVDKAGRLYEFLGMDTSNDIKQMVLGLANGRGRAGYHPFSYRDSLKWSTVEIVNKHCEDIYKELGLTEFTTEKDLRDHTISPVSNPLPYTL